MCVRYIQLTFNVYKILLRHSTQTQYGACLPACLPVLDGLRAHRSALLFALVHVRSAFYIKQKQNRNDICVSREKKKNNQRDSMENKKKK